MALGDPPPVRDRRPAEGVGADPDPRVAYGVQVEDGREVVDVSGQEVVASGGVGGECPGVGNPADLLQPSLDQGVGPVLDPGGGVRSGRPAVRGLYLNPPSAGGLCEGVTTMPSARPPVRSRLYVRIACETAGVGV